MMKKDKKIRFSMLILALLLVITGCSVLQSPAPAPTADADAIAEAVLEQVRLELPADEGEVIPAINASPTLQVVPPSLEASLIGIYQRANPATVYIEVPGVGSGTGFVYSADGYIVTNNHVVDSGGTYEVVFASGEHEWAELVGVDVDSDLAVIKVKKIPDSVTPLSLAEVGSIQVGQLVVAIGNPFGEQGSMSIGIVSGLGRSLTSQRILDSGGSYSLPSVIQTDAAINPGNSGGPLLNLDGDVIGVNSAIRTRSGANEGVGFSIPVDALHRIIPDLIKTGSHAYSYVGASFANRLTLDSKEQLDLPQVTGAYVLGVSQGTPAGNAGLRPADVNGLGGDLIVAIDGTPILDFEDLNSYLVFHTSAGQNVTFTVIRDGVSIELPITLGERP